MSVVSFTISAIDRTRAAFVSVQQGLRNVTRGASEGEKQFAKMSLGISLGAGAAVAALLAMYQNARRVWDTVEKIPGIPQATIDSIVRGRTAMADMRAQLDGVIARGLAFISDVGTGLGFALGSLVYGTEAAADAMTKFNAEAKLPSDLPAKLKEVNERLAEQELVLKRVNEGMGASIKRRREEAAMLRSRAAFGNDLEKAQAILKATELEVEAAKDLKRLRDEQAKGQIQTLDERSQRTVREALNANLERRIRLEKELDALNRKILKNDPNSPVYLEQVIAKQAEYNELTKERRELLREQRKLAAEVGDALASGFEEAVFAGRNLSGVLKGLAQDLLRLMFRNMITAPLANFLTGGITGLFGGGRAVGGPVNAGTSYIVGERGPELFVPSQAGRIIPNHQTSGASGSGGPSFQFTYNIAAGVSRAELMPVLKATQRETISRIADTQRRGLPLAAAMA